MFARPLFLIAITAFLSSAAEMPSVGLVTDFPDNLPPSVMAEFRLETERAMAGADVNLAWRNINQVQSHETFNWLVVLRFRNHAKPQTPAWRDKTLGLTFLSEGQVMPFVELDYDRVRTNSDFNECTGPVRKCSVQLGRALARVAAHEIFHILTASVKHDKAGLMKPSFDKQDLCGSELTFSSTSMRRLKHSLGTESKTQTAD